MSDSKDYLSHVSNLYDILGKNKIGLCHELRGWVELDYSQAAQGTLEGARRFYVVMWGRMYVLQIYVSVIVFLFHTRS